MEKEKLSFRTKELLEILTNHSNRTRYIWIVLNIFSLIIIASMINEKMSGNLPRIEARFWNSNIELIHNMLSETTLNDSTQHSAQGKLIEALKRRDEYEFNSLVSQQLDSFETLKIPVLGISISSRDASFIAAIALLFIYLWYLLAVLKERAVLSQLIYPLCAKTEDKEAQKLWGSPNGEEPLKPADLQVIIDKFKTEVMEIRETISSRFLTLYSKRKRRVFEFITSIILIMAPVIVLTMAVSWDYHWDYGIKFKETGLTFYQELDKYEKELTKIQQTWEDQNNSKGDLSKLEKVFNDRAFLAQVTTAKEEMGWYKKQMDIKLYFSAIALIFLWVIGFRDIWIARKMTKILTQMYDCPKDLSIKKYLDIGVKSDPNWFMRQWYSLIKGKKLATSKPST